MEAAGFRPFGHRTHFNDLAVTLFTSTTRRNDVFPMYNVSAMLPLSCHLCHATFVSPFKSSSKTFSKILAKRSKNVTSRPLTIYGT